MNARDIMTPQPRCCGPDDSLVTAAEIMWETDCGAVPVVDEGRRVIGMITDRDVCMAAYRSGSPLRASTVESAMSDSLCACAPEDSVHDVAALMGEQQLRRIPVIEDDGTIVGIVSLNDLALACEGSTAKGADIGADDVSSTLAAISQHRPNQGASEPH